MIRLLTKEDIPCSRKLWMDRFGDSDLFMDWYFRERFTPEFSAGVFSVQNELICQAHGRPLKLKIGSRTLSVLMIGGVSTHRDHEKQGHMHRVLEFLFEQAEKSGFDALFLAAEHPEIYHSAEFIDCGSCVRINSVALHPCATETKYSDNPDLMNDLFNVYQRASLKYDFMPVRDREDMLRRANECFSAGFLLATVSRDGKTSGYAFYDPESRSSEEIFAESDSDYYELIGSLPDGTDATLPPDQVAFGPQAVLSLIRPITPISETCINEASPFCYCPETY